MSFIRKSVEVGVPVSAAYREWTRFTELTRFLPGVREVRPLDEHRFFWRAEIGTAERAWELAITEQLSEERVAWQTRSDLQTWGSVGFEPVTPLRCRVTFEMHYDPRSFFEFVGDYLGVAGRWVGRGLENFREMMEEPDSRSRRLPPQEELVGH
jgi:uncharacterized membrane protein